MSKREGIGSLLTGTGVIIGAKANWGALPISADSTFVDSSDLPSIRGLNPALRSVTLAPVDITDNTGQLKSVADASVDHVVDWGIWTNEAQAIERLIAAARVLRPGGILILPVCDSRFIGPEDDVDATFAGLSQVSSDLGLDIGSASPTQNGKHHWPLARFAAVIAALSTLASDRGIPIELERVQRHGRFNAAIFRLGSSLGIESRSIVSSGGSCFAVDPPFVRHISSMGVLNKLRAAHFSMIAINEAEQASFVIGEPINESNADAFLAKTGKVYE